MKYLLITWMQFKIINHDSYSNVMNVISNSLHHDIRQLKHHDQCNQRNFKSWSNDTSGWNKAIFSAHPSILSSFQRHPFTLHYTYKPLCCRCSDTDNHDSSRWKYLLQNFVVLWLVNIVTEFLAEKTTTGLKWVKIKQSSLIKQNKCHNVKKNIEWSTIGKYFYWTY